MITQSITIQGLNIISLALTLIDWWKAAKRLFNNASSVELWSILIAAIALMISAILACWIIAKHIHSHHRLKQKTAELTATNEKLRQRVTEPPKEKVLGLSPEEIEALSKLAKRLR